MRRVTRDGLIGFYDNPPKGPLRDDPLPDAFFPPTADGFGVDWAADRAGQGKQGHRDVSKPIAATIPLGHEPATEDTSVRIGGPAALKTGLGRF
ncbi:hypothetical protein EMIHUDRAFT_198697 [Emiliania huxleyi CCMP1516]|uniref:Uncharacterized protein n=2 Tax=Emiliania huxleyi TaxID=2903 RepID=A0A0D3I7Q3_EMIH1|nr:hypothetical protein EMIHUDRAFT_198697 [Emiliania huxleyi CCMP1516]EOD07288.1 hypothetical protein EMIHUDRAFT_198697 [Emiliania huxleyi CCMP1516]|eukprot:XP_005759717.1 hypothetical protein EMIHUDRAFT_198697 [Emiliania huxleyi CCMP1516]